jgi:prepilin-type processing-associated H-X9-DG protein
MKKVALALEQYCTENDGRFPFAYRTPQDLRNAVLTTGLDEQLMFIDNRVSKELGPNEKLEGVLRSAVLFPEETVSFSSFGYWYSDGSRSYAFVDGHVKVVRDMNALKFEPYIQDTMSPLPSRNDFDNAMSYKFRVYEEDYLLSWVHGRTYEVEIERMVEGRWQSVYTGVTMGKPILRQGQDSLTLYLHQPWFQLGEEGPPPAGKEFYEVVTVGSNGVHWNLELLDGINDQQP